LSVASKRRQGGKVETHSDLLRGLEGAEVEEVVIAVIRGERNQEQQGEVGAFYWTVLAPDIVNPGREEWVSIQL